jgi:katanin p60 ATPase-containing subunit A1
VDVADNVDLVSIVQEYEEAFEARYGRRPKLVRQVKEQVCARGWPARWWGQGQRKQAAHSFA